MSNLTPPRRTPPPSLTLGFASRARPMPPSLLPHSSVSQSPRLAFPFTRAVFLHFHPSPPPSISSTHNLVYEVAQSLTLNPALTPLSPGASWPSS